MAGWFGEYSTSLRSGQKIKHMTHPRAIKLNHKNFGRSRSFRELFKTVPIIEIKNSDLRTVNFEKVNTGQMLTHRLF